MLRLLSLFAIVALAGMLFSCASLNAQEFSIPPNATPEMRQKIMEAQAKRSAQAGQRPDGSQPAEDKSKEEKEAGKKPEDEKKPDEDKGTVKRPDKPKQEADPEELEVRPGADGLVHLQFQGQPWPALVDWFGKISGQAIDWRELPSDYLNIRTQRGYTLDETRDLLNRHLLARGFTMLEDGEFITIEKTEGINTALVPRVAPEELVGLMPYSFVKTSFRLHRLMAEDAAKELEPMKSKNGKLVALTSTNRIEAMDAVKNLRQIHAVLQQEQDAGQRTLKEFPLKHVRASDVRTKLEELLGIEKKSSLPLTPQQMQQQMQQMQQRMQQQRQQPDQGQPQQPKSEAPISFVVNQQQNSIIAQAPPNKMYIIGEAIRLLDVPSNRGDSLDSYLGRIRTYRLETLNPEEVVNILLETGGLDPSTTMRVDEDSKAIIAAAPPWDHLVIEKLVEKLDGSARQFKVVRLRRRKADQVATTIETLMVGNKQDDSNSRRRYYWWDDRNEDEDDDTFRVGADIEHNWLLLWCNDNEYQEVMTLLEELGEVPLRFAGSDQVRVLEALPGEDQDAFLERVRRAFEEIAPNPIELPETIIEPKRDTTEPEDSSVKEARDVDADDPVESRTVDRSSPYRTTLTQVRRDALAVEDNDNVARPRRASGTTPAPIRIERDAQGRLIMRSTDTAALDLFAELVDQMAPKQPDYTVFQLEYASATWVALKLEDFFEEEEEDRNNRFPFFFIFDEGRGRDDERQGLGDRRKIRFISEIDTNTILVRNATADQLATIEDLIDIYDVPEPTSTQNARYTKTFNIRYATASSIEETLKDVFRDLLSGNDKAFQQQNQDGENPSRSRSRGSSFFGGFNDDDISSSSPKADFKGKLSFGVNQATNMLIVTTEGKKLMEIVETMITELDEAARPTDDVRVVTLPGGTSTENMRDVLNKIFGQPEPPVRGSEQAPNGENKEGGPPNPNQNPGAQGRALARPR